MISLGHFLTIGGLLFGIGLIGFLTRRNLITMFLCAEMMLQGVVLNLLAFSRFHGDLSGQIFALFIITVAACEAGIALALFVALYRRSHSLDITVWQALREPGILPAVDLEPLLPSIQTASDPRLPVAGRKPTRVEEPSRV